VVHQDVGRDRWWQTPSPPAAWRSSRWSHRDPRAHQTATLVDGPGSSQAVRALGPYEVVLEDCGAAVLDILGHGMGSPRARVVLIAGRDRVDYNFNASQGAELTVMHANQFSGSDLQLVIA